MKHRLNRNFPADLQVGLGEHDARKRARVGRLALVGECEANLGEEAGPPRPRGRMHTPGSSALTLFDRAQTLININAQAPNVKPCC